MWYTWVNGGRSQQQGSTVKYLRRITLQATKNIKTIHFFFSQLQDICVMIIVRTATKIRRKCSPESKCVVIAKNIASQYDAFRFFALRSRSSQDVISVSVCRPDIRAEVRPEAASGAVPPSGPLSGTAPADSSSKPGVPPCQPALPFPPPLSPIPYPPISFPPSSLAPRPPLTPLPALHCKNLSSLDDKKFDDIFI